MKAASEVGRNKVSGLSFTYYHNLDYKIIQIVTETSAKDSQTSNRPSVPISCMEQTGFYHQDFHRRIYYVNKKKQIGISLYILCKVRFSFTRILMVLKQHSR
jgi:hypothetical protein